MPDSLAGSAVELVEVDFALGLSCGEKVNAEGDERDLKLTGPEGACHAYSPNRVGSGVGLGRCLGDIGFR
jgi:hypothetical protein